MGRPIASPLEGMQLSVTPPRPLAGRRLLYAKADGWYDQDPNGTEQRVGAGGSGVAVVPNQPSAPATPADGQLWYDNDDTSGSTWSQGPAAPAYVPQSTNGYQASDYGLASMSFDPAVCTSGQTLSTAGKLYGTRIWLPSTQTVTNIVMHVFTAGATLTSGNNRACLYNSAGTLLGTTADQSATWNSAGVKTMALATPATSVPSGWIDICFWYAGTTSPSFSRGVSSGALVNLNLTGQAMRSFTTTNTSLTATAPATLGTKSAGVGSIWVGVS